jgi:hypothetical protein
METVKVSNKYKVGKKPGVTMVALIKHGIIHFIPVCPLKQITGFIPGLDTEKLRDKI